MSAKIIKFTGLAYGRIEPDHILEANKGKFKEVLVIGLDENGDDAVACSTGYLPDCLWMIERARKFILESKDGP